MYTVDFNCATVDIDRKLTAYISFFANVQRILVKKCLHIVHNHTKLSQIFPKRYLNIVTLFGHKFHPYDPVVSYPKDSM